MITGASGKLTSALSILVALVLAFIAFKVLMGLVRVGVIILIVVVLVGMWQSGTFG
jgi:hypothetical protein